MVATELDNLYAWNGVRRHRELSAIIRSYTHTHTRTENNFQLGKQCNEMRWKHVTVQKQYVNHFIAISNLKSFAF